MTTYQHEPLAYTMKEAVELTRLSRTTLWNAEKRGDLKVVRHGTRILIPRDELIRFIEAGSDTHNHERKRHD